MAEPKVICIIKSGDFDYFVYDTIGNIQKIFTGINLTQVDVVVDSVNIKFYYGNVKEIPTEGVQVIKDNEPPSHDKLNLFSILTYDIDLKDMIARIAEIMKILNIEIQGVKDVITNIILYGSKEKWPKDGGKKRYRSSRKSSSSRRRRSTKRRTTSRKQQKRRRGSRRAH